MNALVKIGAITSSYLKGEIMTIQISDEQVEQLIENDKRMKDTVRKFEQSFNDYRANVSELICSTAESIERVQSLLGCGEFQAAGECLETLRQSLRSQWYSTEGAGNG